MNIGLFNGIYFHIQTLEILFEEAGECEKSGGLSREKAKGVG